MHLGSSFFTFIELLQVVKEWQNTRCFKAFALTGRVGFLVKV